MQYVIQTSIELTVSTSRTVEVAADEEALLGGDELVQQIGELLTEQLRHVAWRSVDTDDADVHGRSQLQTKQLISLVVV